MEINRLIVQIKPNFRILAPQVLCRDNKGAGEDAQRQITIRYLRTNECTLRISFIDFETFIIIQNSSNVPYLLLN